MKRLLAITIASVSFIPIANADCYDPNVPEPSSISATYSEAQARVIVTWGPAKTSQVGRGCPEDYEPYWDSAGGQVAGYSLYKGMDLDADGNEAYQMWVSDFGPNARSYTDYDIQPGDRIRYKVRTNGNLGSHVELSAAVTADISIEDASSAPFTPVCVALHQAAPKSRQNCTQIDVDKELPDCPAVDTARTVRHGLFAVWEDKYVSGERVRYELQYLKEGGSWTELTWPPMRSTAERNRRREKTWFNLGMRHGFGIHLDPDSYACLKVKACTETGGCSGWSVAACADTLPANATKCTTGDINAGICPSGSQQTHYKTGSNAHALEREKSTSPGRAGQFNAWCDPS